MRGGRGKLDARLLEKELEIPRLVGEILARRGLTGVDSVRAFLSPSLEALHDPLLLPDVEVAADRLWRAADRGERILVHGDYDVDGVTAVALVVQFFRRLGVQIFASVPDRLQEGYGLSERAVSEARDRGASVLLTVDCGISGHTDVARARALGIDAIITDHHQPGDSLPPAVAVVAPSRSDARYPNPNLAGVGVAYKLLEAMVRMRPECRAVPEDGLDLVALGTIADVVPLVGENRILVAYGLERLAQPVRVGLRALKEVVGFDVDVPILSWQVAFGLAPRLNAAGRLGTAERAVDLLLAEDGAAALTLARELDHENHERRRKDQETLEEAIERIEAEGIGERRILVLGSEAWHPGVIGIVASRLVQRYRRPVILVAFKDGRGKGSGRSIEGFDLARALERCGEQLETYGGHEQAAGLTLREEAFEGFRERMEGIAEDSISPEMIQPVLKVDGIVELADCDLRMVEWLRLLEPFGEGNPEPVLVSLRAQVVGRPRAVGRGHLRFTLRQGASVVDAVGFGMGDRLAEVETGSEVDVAFALAVDRWSGEPRAQLKVKDFRLSTESRPTGLE